MLQFPWPLAKTQVRGVLALLQICCQRILHLHKTSRKNVIDNETCFYVKSLILNWHEKSDAKMSAPNGLRRTVPSCQEILSGQRRISNSKIHSEKQSVYHLVVSSEMCTYDDWSICPCVWLLHANNERTRKLHCNIEGNGRTEQRKLRFEYLFLNRYIKKKSHLLSVPSLFHG